MKKSHSQKLGYVLFIIGIFLLTLWGYLYVRTTDRIVTPTDYFTSSGVSIEDLSSLTPITTLTMGVVELSVQDIEKMKTFYHNTVGFDIITESENTIDLGDNGTIFLRLKEEKDFTFPKKGEVGLYHIAITHNSRKTLAKRVSDILSKTPERYEGSANHTATEAFYFRDPEGNGLELYYDKPRIEWVWKNGKPVMGSTYLDTAKYIETYRDIPVSEGIADMGHIHLKVGNISEAETFYRDILLFEVMNNIGTALFVSRDKYHHHIGMNTWESLGAKKRTSNTYGLMSFSILYHEKGTYDTVIENLKNAGYPTIWENGRILTEDPWGNSIYIIGL